MHKKLMKHRVMTLPIFILLFTFGTSIVIMNYISASPSKIGNINWNSPLLYLGILFALNYIIIMIYLSFCHISDEDLTEVKDEDI